MRLSRKEALSALRLSLGRMTNEEEIDNSSVLIAQLELGKKKPVMRSR
jgi:cysteine sulfinate desulfinase/cysteine desulfurase-like protein